MPTASGLPQKGEWLIAPGGRLFQVVTRNGNSPETYSLTLLPHPGQGMTEDERRTIVRQHLTGDPPGTMRLLEAAYWLSRTAGVKQWKPYMLPTGTKTSTGQRRRSEAEIRQMLRELEQRQVRSPSHSRAAYYEGTMQALRWALGEKEEI